MLPRSLPALVAVALAFASPALAQRRPTPGPDVPSVRLSQADLGKAADLMNRIADAVSKDPSLFDEVADPPPSETADQMNARLRRSPRVAALFDQAGMSPKEYLQTMVSVAQAQGHMWMQKQGQAKQAPTPDPVVLDNVRLLQSSPQLLARVEDAARRLRDLEQAHEEPAPQGAPGAVRPRATPRRPAPPEPNAPDKG